LTKNKIIPYDPELKQLARKLRNNMAFSEVLLWHQIRKRALGYQFHRQVPVVKYIVDFYCHELMLAIEIDGSYHNHPEVSVSDLARQKELENVGIHFLRFGNNEIKNDINNVLQAIQDWIQLNNSKHI